MGHGARLGVDRSPIARVLYNVSLQLTGDGWREVVVAAALAHTVSQLHLPGPKVARS
ncbi:MAG: hypothetical protein JWL95_2047 [Gemmatimonadetes bacterium]|nr:hypothetical protein [Gemmatimonadota bacterium]